MSGPAAISAEQRRLGRTALVFPQATMAGGLIVFGAALFGLTVLVAGLPWALAGVAFIARSCSWVSPASGRLASLGRALGLFVALGSGLLIADTVQPDLWKGIGGWVPVGIVLSLWLLVVAVVLHLSEPTDLAPPAFGRLVAVRALLTLLAGYLLLYAAANAVDTQCEVRCETRVHDAVRYGIAGGVAMAIRIWVGRLARRPMSPVPRAKRPS
jgi:hypothetical protein